MAKPPQIKPALENISSRLASITFLPRGAGDVIHVQACATFGPVKDQPVGDYIVSFGLKEAILHLEHNGHEINQKYQASLSRSVFSEKWNSKKSSSTKFAIGGRIKLAYKTLIGADITTSHAIDRSYGDNTSIDKSYNIITPVPDGWRIGSELGDPRAPVGVHSDKMEHCLDGQYFTGASGEEGIGQKMADTKLALCVLTPKAGKNDTQITATILVNSSSLCISLKIKPVPDPAGIKASAREIDKQKKAKEIEIRQKLIQICINKAGAANADNPTSLSYSEGFFPLTRPVTKSAPKLGSQSLSTGNPK
jgi:hypothetical protein